MIEITNYNNIDNILVEDDKNYIIFITEDFISKIDDIRKKFKNINFYGVIVPHIIVNKDFFYSSIAVMKLERTNIQLKILNMAELSSEEKLFLSNINKNSIILFVDGISKYFKNLINNLNNILDKNIKVIGAGLGYKDFSHKFTIFDEDKTYVDHSLIIGIDQNIYMGFSHGWKPIYGPLVVTKSKENILYELNGEPAFEVYKKVLKEIDNQDINKENFFEIAKNYPFAMLSFANEDLIVRNPVSINDDGSIQIVSSIDEMESLYIMKGEKDKLIESSCKFANELFVCNSKGISLIFDCISRLIFLGDEFKKEIETIYKCGKQENLKLFGISSIGEITNLKFSDIKIFNKTILMGIIDDK